MGILAAWDDRNKTRVHIEFETEWSWADLENAIVQVDRFIASVAHKVDIIIDVEGSSIPKDFMNAAKSLFANGDPRANEGRRVVVGANKVLKGAYQALQKAFSDQLSGREVLFAEDLMQARAILHSLRMED